MLPSVSAFKAFAAYVVCGSHCSIISYWPEGGDILDWEGNQCGPDEN